jgi:hypothetical protein
MPRGFGVSAPLGDQALLSYQIAALLVGQNTVGATNFPLYGGVNYYPSTPIFAPLDQRFSNMTEIVGIETESVSTSYIANSGIHYGYRQKFISKTNRTIAHLSDQLPPRLQHACQRSNENDIGDTHSLELLVDSFSLMAVIGTRIDDRDSGAIYAPV